MHAEEVLFGKALLHPGMETLFKLARDVRPFHAYGRVHGVIGRSAVDANPTELHRHRPGGEAVVGPRMFAEVSREVLLGHASIVTCPPGVPDQDVPPPYLHLALGPLRCMDAPLAHL